MDFFSKLFASLCVVSMLALVGCEDGGMDVWDDVAGSSTEESGTASSNTSTGVNSSTASNSSASSNNSGATGGTSSGNSTVVASGDQVSYRSLKWTYGGMNASGASLSSPRIANLRINGDILSYKWAGATLRAWGLSDSDLAICAFFYQRADGSWVGGKFDWISTSRTTRNFMSHCNGGYSNWTLSGAPNPCQVAFVIVSADGKKRSNVITTTWSR